MTAQAWPKALVVVDSSDSVCSLLPTLESAVTRLGFEVSYLDVADFNLLGQWNLRLKVAAYATHPICVRSFLGTRDSVELDTDLGQISNLDPDSEVSQALKAASLSEITSTFATSKFSALNLLATSLLRKCVERSRQLYAATSSLFLRTQYGAIVIPNGRLSHQKPIELAARKLGIRVFFYEKSLFQRGLYLREYAPHDRTSRQRHILAILEENRALVDQQTSSAWLAGRASPRNEFYSPAVVDRAFTTLSGRRVSIFTSSADEFAALPGWGRGAFTEFLDGAVDWLKSVEADEPEIVIRLHPNLLQRPVLENLQETLRVNRIRARFQKCKVFGPTHKLDIYRLIEASDDVLVSNSTVGLEASLMGKRVWSFWDTPWDLVANNAKWPIDPSEKKLFEQSNPSASGAQGFVWADSTLDQNLGASACLGRGAITISDVGKLSAAGSLVLQSITNPLAFIRTVRFARQAINRAVFVFLQRTFWRL